MGGPRLGPGVRPYLPRDEEGCFLWLRSDLGITISGTGGVSAWANQGTAGGTFTQGTASQQPSYTVSGIANWPTLGWTQAARTFMINSTITNAASDYQFFFACNPTLTQAATGVWLMDIVTGRLIFTQADLASPNGRVAFFNGAAYQCRSLGTTGAQILTFELLSGGATNGKIYRNNTAIGINGDYSTQRAVGGNVNLGTANTGGAGWFQGSIFEVIGINKPSATVRDRVNKYLGARYGITVA